ncbi:MAG TPA: 50S ribosomal protein L18 [Planctomycetaceae bacterium]|jgi:large subunit ribosomal protein L18|nr:50S ribosomal protein L18 [Planctomycetaceae bacterium]
MTIETILQKRRTRRTFRVRNRIRKSRSTRPRLTVFRSNRHMYAQIIDDEAGRTLVSASTVEKDLFGAGKYAGNKDAAIKVGQKLAARAIERGIKEVVFDRGPYKYHGRVQVLADAVRQGGVEL